MLLTHQDIFQGQIRHWNGDQIRNKLKPGTTPYKGKAFRIPHAYIELVCDKVNQLNTAEILERVDENKLEAPCFIISKKDGGICC